MTFERDCVRVMRDDIFDLTKKSRLLRVLTFQSKKLRTLEKIPNAAQ
ncbi:MAG TPA: hypothetical protein VF596_08965 [Pyrinomonadaceae bacterium]